MLIFMNKTLSGHLGELKNKGKVQLGNPKRGSGRLRERSQGGLRMNKKTYWPLLLGKQVFFLEFYCNGLYSTSLMLSVVFRWGHLIGE